MNRYLLFGHKISLQKLRSSVLALFWLIGLGVGIAFALSYFHVSPDYFKVLLSKSVSPAFSFFAAGLPIAISAFALWYPAFFLIYPLVFVNAVCRGFNGILVHVILGSGAWLIRLLYLFSSSCISVIMWWLLLRHSNLKGPTFSKDVRLVSILTCIIVAIDIIIVSPFLTVIAKYI